MAQLLFPNIAGQAMQGFQQGQGMRANRLIGLAMQNPDQSQQLFGQAATINPQAVMQVQDAQARNDYMQQLGAAQQQRVAQAQQSAQLQKVKGAVTYMAAALKSGNPAMIEGAYQSVRPWLAEMGAAQGKTPPPQWDPNMAPAVYQLAAQLGAAAPESAASRWKYDPTGGVMVNTQTGQFRPVTEADTNGMGMGAPVSGSGAGGAPQAPAAGLDTTIPGQNGETVKFDFPPGTPPEVIAAAKAAAVAHGDLSQQQAAQVGGEPQAAPQAAPETLAQYRAGNKQVVTLTPEQVKAAGLPDGTVAQRDPNGSIRVVSKPTDMGESGMGLLTDDGKALMDAAIAHGYNMPMPSMGYGKAGTAAKAAAINSLAERFKAAGKSPDEAVSMMIQGNTATSGLRSLQHINAKIAGWEQSAAKQADIALDMSNRVSRTGVPIFNSWLLAGRQGTGSVEVAQFNNTVNTLAEEYAKVMSGGSSSAATDSMRALAHHMLNSAMTAQQFAGVVAKMRQEMTARTEALNEAVMSQRGAITSDEGGNMGGWPGEPAQAQQAPQGAAQAPSGFDAAMSKYGQQ